MCPRTFLTTLVCSKNKDADQLCGYCAADLCLAYAKSKFSHDTGYNMFMNLPKESPTPPPQKKRNSSDMLIYVINSGCGTVWTNYFACTHPVNIKIATG